MSSPIQQLGHRFFAKGKTTGPPKLTPQQQHMQAMAQIMQNAPTPAMTAAIAAASQGLIGGGNGSAGVAALNAMRSPNTQLPPSPHIPQPSTNPLIINGGIVVYKNVNGRMRFFNYMADYISIYDCGLVLISKKDGGVRAVLNMDGLFGVFGSSEEVIKLFAMGEDVCQEPASPPNTDQPDSAT